MKKRLILTIFISFLFFLGYSDNSFAAMQTIPGENAPTNQRDRYQTDLFTGSATYSYPIKVPKGTNGLTPDVSLSYSSSAIHDPSTQEGLGWQLNRDYIQRDVNYTPWDTSDDKFKLHFQGATYDLVYNASDSLFHTQIESHLKIQEFLTGGQGTTGIYWQVTTTDGTMYRFGYASNAELVCNGQSYDSYWNVDQVQDTHNNHIYYSYTQSTGVAYLSQITYNNDQAREIDFSYGTNPYHKPIYIQGCMVDETSQLNTIQVKANSNLVHEYDLGFIQAPNGQNLLNTITEKGTDGSALPPTSFTYSGEDTGSSTTSDYTNGYNIDADLTHSDVQLCDMNGDGYPDLVKTVGSGNYTWETKLNNGSYFAQNWTTMGSIPVQLGAPNMRLLDVNGDGKCDIVETVQVSGNNYNWFVWPNTSQNGNLSFGGQQTWDSNMNFDNGAGLADSQYALVDMNGDGLPDIVHVGQGNSWQVYPNVAGQNTWNPNPPHQTWASNISSFNNPNIKLVDINGDGLPDVVQSNSNGGPNETYLVYFNTGYSLLPAATWINNANIDAIDLTNHNVVIADVNGDGLPDIVRGNGFDSSNTSAHWQVLYNMGDHFSTTIQTWFDAQMDGSSDFNGVKLADINGDGQVDVLNQAFGKWDGFVGNTNAPDILTTIHTQQGGIIRFGYNPSTRYNNNGNLPFPIWLVNSMIVNNGMNNSQQTNDTTTYNYLNGLYNYQKHEFRGFGEVDETDPNTAKKVYLFNQDDATKGKVTEIDINDAQGNPFSKILNTWSNTQANNIYSVNLTAEKQYTYDGSANNPKNTETDYQYDQYGNLTKKSELGDTGTTGDERFTYNIYTANPALWIVNTLSDSYINKADDATKVSETWNYYDNNVNLTDPPTKGDLTKQVKWLNGGTNPVTTYTYDSYGNQTQTTDANNHTTQYVYGVHDTTNTYPDHVVNAKNQTTDTVTDLGTGNVLSKTDANGSTTTYTYDPFGRISKEIDPYDTATYPTLTYQYFDTASPHGVLISKRQTSGITGTLDMYTFIDGLGRTIQTRVPAQDTTKQIVADTYYDPNGKVARQSVPHLDTVSNTYVTPLTSIENTSTGYDVLKRITLMTSPQGTTKATTYDHWTQTNTDENGHAKKEYFDAYNNILQVDEYNSGIPLSTFYSYDTQNNMTKILDAAGNIITYTFDTLSRKIAMADGDMGTWHYAYDGVGNMTAQTDNRAITTNKTYDELNRLTKVDYPTDPDTLYQYDNNTIGTLSQVTDTAGVVNYTYDQRLRKMQEQRVTDGTTWTTQYSYDAANRLTTQTNPDGEVLTYTYNPQGEIQNLNGIITAIDYNALGKILDKHLSNGLVTNYTYNTDDFRLNRIQTALSSSPAIQDVAYTYDAVGNVASTTDNLTNKTQTFTYDNLNRLLTAQETNGYTYAYTYDPIGNLTSFINAGNTISYTYGQSSGPHALTASSETVTPTPTPTPGQGIALRSVASATNASGGSSLVINKPTETTNGDIMIAHVIVQQAGNTITPPTGWNLIQKQDSTSSIATATYWKLATSSEPTTYTWNFGTAGEASGGIASYIGVNNINPIDASVAQYNSATSTVTTQGVTTTNAHDMLVFAVGIAVPTTVNTASGFHEEWSTTSSSVTTSEMSDEIDPNIGATGIINASHNGGANSNVTQLIALRPVGSGNSSPTPTLTPTDTLLSQGQPIVATSQKTGYEAPNANDGTINTYWEAQDFTYPASLTVDLGAVYTVDKVVMELNWGTRTENVAILGSTDNTTFSPIVPTTNYSLGTVPVTFAATNVRYVRITVNSNSAANAAQIAEFQVWGISSSNATPSPSPTGNPTFTPTSTVTPTSTMTPTLTPTSTATPTPSGSSIQIDGTIKSTHNTGGNITLSNFSVTGSNANRFLLVAVGSHQGGGSTGATSVKYGATSLTRLASVVGQYGEYVQLWGLEAPAGGTANIVTSGANGGDFTFVTAYSLYHVKQTYTVKSGTKSQSSNTSSISVTPNSPNNWIIDAIESEPVPSTSGSNTQDWSQDSSPNSYDNGNGSRIVQSGGPTAVSMSWRLSYGGRSNQAVVALEPY